MNAPFDAAGIAENAVQQAEAGVCPLVLSPAAPTESARLLIQHRYTELGARTLHHLQRTFYHWSGTHYRVVDREDMRACVYEFLESAKRLNDGKLVAFNPNRNMVDNVIDALSATAQLRRIVCLPDWLDNAAHLAAADILACSDALVPTIPHRAGTYTRFFGVNAVSYPYDPGAKKTGEVVGISRVNLAGRSIVN